MGSHYQRFAPLRQWQPIIEPRPYTALEPVLSSHAQDNTRSLIRRPGKENFMPHYRIASPSEKAHHSDGIVGALDLGSKTFKLVKGYESGGRIYTELCRKVTVNLGAEVDQTGGVIGTPKLREIETVLAGLADDCRKTGISRMLAIATSAINATKNKDDVLNLARGLGIELEIADGHREGNVGYLAATHGAPYCLVTEMGSHSSQVAWQHDEKIHVHRVQAGYSRCYDEFFAPAEHFGAAIESFRSFLDEQMGLVCGSTHRFKALAANTVAGFVTGKSKEEVAEKSLTQSEIGRKIAMLRQMSHRDFEIFKQETDKVQKILPGLMFLDHMLEKTGYENVHITTAELPVGLIVEHFQQRRDHQTVEPETEIGSPQPS